MVNATCLPLAETVVDSHPFGDGAKRERVYQGNHFSLFKYQTISSPSCSVPMCVVYALVNKPYILDLSPKKSFLRPLIEQGISVYLIEWDDPGETMINPTLDDYINYDIHRAVEWLKKEHNVPSVNLLGICQGGTFSLMYAALYPHNVKNLITLVTPIEFKKEDNLFSQMSQYWSPSTIRETWKSIPGNFMNTGFLNLKPFELMIGKYLGLPKILNEPKKRDLFMRMEKWIFDSPKQSTVAWQKFIEECYQKNNLVKAKTYLGNKVIDLSKIECPILNIAAEKDHLVPLSASQAIERVTSSQDYTFATYPTGHIGMFVSSLVRKKVAPQIVKWLLERCDENAL